MKKVLVIVMAILILASFSAFSSALSPRKGDVDNDGIVTASDARFILRYSVGLGEEDGVINKENFTNADIDCNRVIEPEDARLVLRSSVGLPIV